METRQSIRHRESLGAPPVLRAWELCWHVDGTLYLGIGDDGTGWATDIEPIVGIGATVSWGQITGIPAYATRWPAWSEVTGKPSFATVATSGDYDDLSGKVEWVTFYTVNVSSPAKLKNENGTSPLTGYIYSSTAPGGIVYECEAVVTSTGTQTSAVALFQCRNGTWTVENVFEAGTVSNNVRFFLDDDGEPAVSTWHASNYNVAVTTRRHGARESVAKVAYDTAATAVQPGDTGVNIDITGNAATATKLATARTIGGVSFDGSANINLPGVNTDGNQNTTGNAATATKLATPRTISLTGQASGSASFDGSANVSINVTGIAAPAMSYLTAGNGFSGTAYNGTAARTWSLGTPSSCSPSTSNATTTSSHTHALTGVAASTTSISAGDGLSGGGTLAANRTLAVDSTVWRSDAAYNGGVRFKRLVVQSTTPSSSSANSGTLYLVY